MSDPIMNPEHDAAALRKRVEALQPLAEQYELIVGNICDYALIRFDLDNRVTGWHMGAERMLGFREDEILGESGSRFFTPEDIASGEPERELATAAAKGRAEDEPWHVRKDGARFWGSGVLSPIRDGAGQVQGYFKILRDLTARKQAEDPMRQSEARLRRFIENVRDYALVQVDSSGSVTSWNPGAQRIFGYAESEILHQPVSILFTPEDRDAGLPERDLEIALAQGRSEEERWLVRKDKTRLISLWVTTPIRDEDGRLLGFAKVLRDETERRRAEERLRASLIERDTLLKEIHHRVKNNLQVIVSLLALQSDQVCDPAARAMLYDTQGRVRAIARIHETLYSSADLAQIEFAQYTRALSRDLLAFYDVSPDRIRLQLSTEEIVLEITQAIPLGLILNELVANCIKHAFPGNRSGTVEVSLRYLDETVGPDQTLDEGMGELCVRDNGIGLPPEFHFERAESMGIYLVRALTRQMRGSVKLDQQGGTCICVRFPLTLDPTEAARR